MSIDCYNDRIIDLWYKYEGKKKLKLSPLLYSKPHRKGILFICLNPSFPYKDTKDLALYKFSNIDKNRNEIIKRRAEHMKDRHQFFKLFREIAEYLGFNEKWAQIDLFYYRESDQNKIGAIMLDNEKLNSFACDQLEISLEIIDYIRPKIIVLANKLARDILQGEYGEFVSDIKVDDIDNKSHTYNLKIKDMTYPAIYKPLTGRQSNIDIPKKKRQIRRFVDKLSLR